MAPHCGGGEELQVSSQSCVRLSRPHCSSRISSPPSPNHRPLPRSPTSWEDGQALEVGSAPGGGAASLARGKKVKSGGAAVQRTLRLAAFAAVAAAQSKNWLSPRDLQTLTAPSSPIRRLFPLVSLASSAPTLPPPSSFTLENFMLLLTPFCNPGDVTPPSSNYLN